MTREEILSKAKPILFNSEMVRAILDGRKTQTRRAANINDKVECHGVINNHEFVKDETGFHCHKCGFGVVPPHSRYPVGTSFFRPRYNVSDYLYVRETWGDCDGNYILYRADYPNGATTYDFGDEEHICDLPKWHPSIHMPKEAARIFLRVTGVKAERLQDIDEDGASLEGVDIWDDACQDENWHPTYYDPDSGGFPSFVNGFISLWNSTIKPADLGIYGWNANPWVWVYEFERVNND